MKRTSHRGIIVVVALAILFGVTFVGKMSWQSMNVLAKAVPAVEAAQ